MSIVSESPRKRERKFVPEDFAVMDWEHLKPYFDHLMAEPIDTVEALEDWLLKASELEFVVSEDNAWRYIRMTCDTENEPVKERFQYFVREIMPHLSVMENALLRKVYASPAFEELDPHTYEILIRSIRSRIELFRAENVPLQSELRQKSQQFDEIAGGLFIEWEGEKMTLQKAASLLEGEDRDIREQVWRKTVQARLARRADLDALFSGLVQLRHQIALNAGEPNFAAYKFKELGRFDYGREDCEEFHRSIELVLKPVLLERGMQRSQRLDLDSLRPWDLNVDEFGGSQLRPFKGSKDLVDKLVRVFNKVDPSLGGYFETMREMGHLDLESRLGKAPGGYNYSLPETGVPFIFMNAVGTNSDLSIMIHEGGHAVHAFLTQYIELSDFTKVPSEVAELASMSMELLCLDFLDEVYSDPKDLLRAKREQLGRIFSILPWIATIDAFQFWSYDHPEADAEQRAAAWKALFLRFHGDYIDFSGHEEVLESYWQKQGHVYDVPFYYIEYGFAQLGAIAVWRNFKRDRKKGLDDFLEALKMGYTRPIPEIYERAGVLFDFSAGYIQELVDFLKEELQEIEAGLQGN